MRIEGGAAALPNLYRDTRDAGAPKLEYGPAIPGLKHDSVEISEASRRLAEGISTRELPPGVVQDRYLRRMFNSEIDGSLNRLLEGKSPEVEQAVNFLISSNFVPDESVSDEGERAALLESGLSQAKFIADNYMTESEAADFMTTMNKIAAYAKTRTVDPETGKASYIELPRRPEGAPGDYIDIDYLMKKYDPEAAKQAAASLKDASSGGSGSGFAKILMDFQRKLANHPEWTREYRGEVQRANDLLNNAKIDNRFAGADTSSLDAFLQDMNGKFRDASFESKDFLTKNLESFSRILDNAK
ncbi:hypothetical protein J19TS2_36310 [Cohnella xylanilytica]|uniref:Uncharacterized protein n=1 Tax=Cohnella xylanilytica TaxID=557555 RepID=A0A841TZA2_9BACL|nr:hypothetical protein [Cohnella xylanilytica]MBB6693877.1 hypothetical protein [Cohnella xylanilytica]GIO14076.1 hypothetical protein J19TS2_36310 [Cohnella xylanilytica]